MAIVDEKFKHSELTGKVIKASMAVHNELGTGFQEIIYQRALAIEMQDMSLGFERECEMPIQYKSKEIGTRRVDFLVDGIVCVELKALTKLENVHYAQAINYLEAFNLEVGLLVNFGSTSLEFKRFVNKKFKPKP